MNVFDEVPDLGSADDFERYLTDNGWTPAQVAAAVERLKVTWLDEEKYENSDNLRMARVDSPDEVADYEGFAETGCCGSFDETIDTIDGAIMIGFNYGH